MPPSTHSQGSQQVSVRGGPHGSATVGGRGGGPATAAQAGPAGLQALGNVAPPRWWHQPQLKEQAAEITDRVASSKGHTSSGDAASKQNKQQQGLAVPLGSATTGVSVNGPTATTRAAQQQPQPLASAGRNIGGAVPGGVSRTVGAPAPTSNTNPGGNRGQGSVAAAAAAAAAVAAEQAQAKVQQQAQALFLHQALLQQQQQMLQYGPMGHQAPFLVVGQAPLAAAQAQTPAVYGSAQQQLTPAQQQHVLQQLTPVQLQQLQHLTPAQQQLCLQQLALGGGTAPECKQQ